MSLVRQTFPMTSSRLESGEEAGAGQGWHRAWDPQPHPLQGPSWEADTAVTYRSPEQDP